MFDRFMFVFDLLFILFRKVLWPSAGKELSSWVSALLFSFYAVLIVRVLFTIGVWGQDAEFDYFIGS